MDIKSRKLLSGVVLFIVATVALFVDKSTFSEWSGFMQIVFGIYVVGNVGEKYVNNSSSPKP